MFSKKIFACAIIFLLCAMFFFLGLDYRGIDVTNAKETFGTFLPAISTLFTIWVISYQIQSARNDVSRQIAHSAKIASTTHRNKVRIDLKKLEFAYARNNSDIKDAWATLYETYRHNSPYLTYEMNDLLFQLLQETHQLTSFSDDFERDCAGGKLEDDKIFLERKAEKEKIRKSSCELLNKSISTLEKDLEL